MKLIFAPIFDRRSHGSAKIGVLLPRAELRSRGFEVVTTCGTFTAKAPDKSSPIGAGISIKLRFLARGSHVTTGYAGRGTVRPTNLYHQSSSRKLDLRPQDGIDQVHPAQARVATYNKQDKYRFLFSVWMARPRGDRSC